MQGTGGESNCCTAGKNTRLGHEAGEEGIGGDVEWHPQTQVAAALVHLAGELPICHVELAEHVAGWQRHVRQRGRVPCREHQPAVVCGSWVGGGSGAGGSGGGGGRQHGQLTLRACVPGQYAGRATQQMPSSIPLAQACRQHASSKKRPINRRISKSRAPGATPPIRA